MAEAAKKPGEFDIADGISPQQRRQQQTAPQNPAEPAPRRPHPDVEPAVTGANTDRSYHIARITCMNGERAERYEERVKNPPRQRIPNPPVGEFCIGLLRNSADVNANPQRLNDRPETSLLAPYLGMNLANGRADTSSAAFTLAGRFVRVAESPENQSKTQALRFDTNNPPRVLTREEIDAGAPYFVLTQGTALDAAFTRTVMDVRANRTPKPAIPSTNREQLYTVTDSCFRNLGVTLQQCVDAGRDQAALYLNQQNTVSQAEAPAATPAQLRRTGAQRN